MARIDSITARTAVAATIATVGFGGLAAFTYSGTPGATYAVDTGTTTVDGTTDGTTNDTTTSGGSASGTTSGLQAVPAPTASTKHKARVTSGGSSR